MKKLITFLFIIFVSLLFANPIAPKYFSEIYFEGDEWQIELAYTDFFEMWEFDNFDNHRLVTNTDTAYFKSGIDLTNISIIVINQDSLLSNLFIDKTSDVIYLQENYGSSWYENDHFGWGYLNPLILHEGQSLVNKYFGYWGYIKVKDNEPTLGYEPYFSNASGTLSGRVFDLDNNPINGAEISITPDFSPNVFTDETGFFEMVDIVTMIYQQMQISYDSYNLYPDGEYYVEPDSTTYYEFILDITDSETNQINIDNIHNLTNHPNPFNPTTIISFQISDFSDHNLEIQIFNSKGQRVNQFSILNDQSSITWDGTNSICKTCPSGVYLYKLVSNGKELAANKMLLLK